jgi:hypothetical protein
MSKLIFDGNSSWYISPNSQYGLSTYPIKKLTTDNFSFVVKVKIDWSKLDGSEEKNQYGIVTINGMHMGINVYKGPNSECYIRGKIWTEDEHGNNTEFENSIKLIDSEDEFDIVFSVDIHNNETFLYCNGRTNTLKLSGRIIDYTNSLFWIGSSTASKYVDKKYQHFMYGEISYVAIIPKLVNINELENLFVDYKNNPINKNSIAAFDFETRTNYKVLDLSGHGNNLIKYDTAWVE